MKKVLILSLMVALGGCAYPVYVQRPVSDPQPTFVYEEHVMYPNYASAYFWDAALGIFFWTDGRGYRHHMPRGWDHRRHGFPQYRR